MMPRALPGGPHTRYTGVVSKESGRLLPENTVVTIVSHDALEKERASQIGCLVVIVGSEIGKRVELGDTDIVIGRSSSSDLQLDMDNVSRSHASVDRTPLGWVIRDLGSTNGTFVNDIPVREHVLHDGDQIRIGRAMLKFLTGDNVEAHYHEEIYKLMTLDGLTQVHNRRFFQEALEREFARSKRYGNKLTLVVFDIDHFKKVNDGHGHLAGDEVLRRVATLVKNKVRMNDTVARTGGEEFAVILPEADRLGGVAFAEKLRRLVESERTVFEDTTIPVTISLGIAEYAGTYDSAEQLLKAADEYLYEAKRTGRNRACS
jgi:two-component system, cell cycle response regulator